MRGLAVLIMIQCHTFNSFSRLDLREGGPYVLSQFVGGMAAPLFLFMSGMTLAFQMESAARRVASRPRRWLAALRRAGYILGIAYLFRITNWAASLPHADPAEITKVDILNCMAAGMLALSGAALFDSRGRIRFAIGVSLAIAVAAPLMTYLPWDGAPALLREYMVPGPGRGRFPFFPFASYVGFGLAAGAILRRTVPDRLERLVQWSVLIAIILVFGAQYFANLPYSVYPQSDFWLNSPALILIRVGVCLLLLAASYLWTEFGAGSGWSWMECLGKNSLMVYWVHVMLVYGSVAKPIKRTLGIPGTALATLSVMALMVGLSAAWMWWKARRVAERFRLAVASSQ
jgi:uncharacterized membrane protein